VRRENGQENNVLQAATMSTKRPMDGDGGGGGGSGGRGLVCVMAAEELDL
jgi:hypothetical protein